MLDTLVEHWTLRRDELGDGAHPFFLQPLDIARARLEQLAHRLDAVCKQDEELFRATTLDLLRTLTEPRDEAPIAGLRVVDISVDDNLQPTTLDIKVRNTAREPCFVKAVEIDVLQVGILYQWYRPNLQPAAAQYDVEFDPREPVPYAIQIDASQAIEPRGTDRFVLRLAHAPDFNWFVHNVLVRAAIRLVYNEDSASSELMPLLLTVSAALAGTREAQ